MDAKPQKPEEDEVTCSICLLKRVIERYPRAFDVVVGDALYTDPRFYHFLVDHKKDVLTVLKNDRRDLIADATALFTTMPPTASPFIKQRMNLGTSKGLLHGHR